MLRSPGGEYADRCCGCFDPRLPGREQVSRLFPAQQHLKQFALSRDGAIPFRRSGVMVTRHLFGYEAQGKGRLVRVEGLGPSRALRPNGFLYPTTALAAPAVMPGFGSGLSLHRGPDRSDCAGGCFWSSMITRTACNHCLNDPDSFTQLRDNGIDALHTFRAQIRTSLAASERKCNADRNLVTDRGESVVPASILRPSKWSSCYPRMRGTMAHGPPSHGKCPTWAKPSLPTLFRVFP